MFSHPEISPVSVGPEVLVWELRWLYYGGPGGRDRNSEDHEQKSRPRMDTSYTRSSVRVPLIRRVFAGPRPLSHSTHYTGTSSSRLGCRPSTGTGYRTSVVYGRVRTSRSVTGRRSSPYGGTSRSWVTPDRVHEDGRPLKPTRVRLQVPGFSLGFYTPSLRKGT